jgi:hypothetical protein
LGGEEIEEGDDGGKDLTNVQCKATRKWHNSPVQ